MAVENLGGDVVLNNYFAGINNAYNREQQRVQKEAQDNLVLANQQKKELDGLVKGINTNVAREKDIPLINKKRSELYDTYYQASKAESTEERLKLKLQLQNQIQDMGQLVVRSKQRASELANLGKQLGDPKNTGLYGADVIERYKKLTDSSSDLINDEDVNPINFRANDFSYLNKTVDAIGKEIFDLTSKTITSAGSMKVGNKSGTVVQTDKTVDPKEFAKALIYKYDNDPVFKNQTDAQTQLLGGQVTPTDYLATLAQTQYEKYKGKGGSQKFEKDMVVKVGGGDTGTAFNFRQQSVVGLLQKNADWLGRVKANLLPTAELGYVTKNSEDKTERKGTTYIRIKTPTAGFSSTTETILIDPSDPHAATKLNTYLGLITGEKHSGSKFGMQQGKPTGNIVEPLIRDKVNNAPPKKNTPPAKKDSKGKYDNV